MPLDRSTSATFFMPIFSNVTRVGNFWAPGYYVDTVGRNEEQIRKYIKDQTESDKLEDIIKVKSYFRDGKYKNLLAKPALSGVSSILPL